MIETLATFVARTDGRDLDSGDDLTRYRFHTGADLRRLGGDEPCPILFRDLGPVATARFLRGTLRRLAGPLSPILYMRTEGYAEPYVDHERIGRLAILRPLALRPWHSGVATIYVARSTRSIAADALGFIPGDVPLAEAARLAADLHDARELREALGGRNHDEAVADTLQRLDRLARELETSETLAGPLRDEFQSAAPARRDRATALMDGVGLVEVDLCTAWHHLPRDRRHFVADALRRIGPIGGRPHP
ncbi:hypothetical protein [Singulisphaera sp. GP187]|uniref:hypothetical protein n=1 Tax=Singulisphaera sp. GP187 TaxID=1882752 RepID=UPI001160F208|nr:hypothetical protein [Singulisphaera sp. GP187]